MGAHDTRRLVFFSRGAARRPESIDTGRSSGEACSTTAMRCHSCGARAPRRSLGPRPSLVPRAVEEDQRRQRARPASGRFGSLQQIAQVPVGKPTPAPIGFRRRGPVSVVEGWTAASGTPPSSSSSTSSRSQVAFAQRCPSIDVHERRLGSVPTALGTQPTEKDTSFLDSLGDET